MTDTPSKCPACAVPLHVGDHTFEQDGRRWHCACLLRSQRGEIEVLRQRVDEMKAACRRVCNETDWCPLCEQNPSTGHARSGCALAAESTP